MDISLFQFCAESAMGSPISLAATSSSSLEGATCCRQESARVDPRGAASTNLDMLRSFAVLTVVCFHLVKFFDWHFGKVRVTDFGLLGVMLFFVHTTVVLMFSLERQRAAGASSLFVPFMIRRVFRIYPLAVLVVSGAYVFRIPSDLQFGRFNLLHQSAANLLANFLLIQNVTLQKANPGVLWSLPLEIQMYLALPALFLFASQSKSAWTTIALWWLAVGLWLAAGYFGGVLPLSDGKIRSPIEAFLKYTRFVPCFLPGVVAYKLCRGFRIIPAALWPVFLLSACWAFLLFSGSQPIETGWFVCFAIGMSLCLFREMRENSLTRAAKRIARYSYGIYLLHYFAIWLAFDVCRAWNAGLQTSIFLVVLVSLSVILYHAVEAPLIAVGIRVSEKFRSHPRVLKIGNHSAEPAAEV